MASTLVFGLALSKQIKPASANDAVQQPLNQTEYFISQISEPVGSG